MSNFLAFIVKNQYLHIQLVWHSLEEYSSTVITQHAGDGSYVRRNYLRRLPVLLLNLQFFSPQKASLPIGLVDPNQFDVEQKGAVQTWIF